LLSLYETGQIEVGTYTIGVVLTVFPGVVAGVTDLAAGAQDLGRLEHY